MVHATWDSGSGELRNHGRGVLGRPRNGSLAFCACSKISNSKQDDSFRVTSLEAYPANIDPRQCPPSDVMDVFANSELSDLSDDEATDNESDYDVTAESISVPVKRKHCVQRPDSPSTAYPQLADGLWLPERLGRRATTSRTSPRLPKPS
ncbi:hypothetical protein B0H13DRAFT_1852016 [Mycena leptocephala]|nr:hypothetical protein B0H13DRAFT_1852016 [Mycena leptocephala]